VLWRFINTCTGDASSPSSEPGQDRKATSLRPLWSEWAQAKLFQGSLITAGWISRKHLVSGRGRSFSLTSLLIELIDLRIRHVPASMSPLVGPNRFLYFLYIKVQAHTLSGFPNTRRLHAQNLQLRSRVLPIPDATTFPIRNRRSLYIR